MEPARYLKVEKKNSFNSQQVHLIRPLWLMLCQWLWGAVFPNPIRQSNCLRGDGGQSTMLLGDLMTISQYKNYLLKSSLNSTTDAWYG